MFDIGRRAQMNIAGDAIDDHCIAGFNQIDNIGDVADSRDAERAGNDRDMAQGAGFLEDKAANLGAIVFEQRGRPHGARDND